MEPKSILIIGDIAGQYNALIKLIRKAPKTDLIVAVGDLIDRGPNSKKVIEYFMKNSDTTEVVLGNHEQMMYEACAHKGHYSSYSIWMRNGGGATIRSYGGSVDDISKEHLGWISQRPLYFETNDLFVSHAPVSHLDYIPEDKFSRDYRYVGLNDDTFIWNRYPPYTPQFKFLVHGHNGFLQEYRDDDGKLYGMCVDNSQKLELAAMHWPSREIFTQKFRRPKQKV